MNNRDANAKRETIRAYFDRLQEKADFTAELNRTGHRDEALLLCCVYIEALGNRLYWPREGARANFARILVEHGGDTRLALVHPKVLLKALGSRKDLRGLADKLASRLPCDPVQLVTLEDLDARASMQLTDSERRLLDEQKLLGTLASIAYARLRSSLAHLGGGPKAILFSQATYQGKAAPEVEFDSLHGALLRVISVLRRRSLDANAFFGHDLRSQEQQRSKAG